MYFVKPINLWLDFRFTRKYFFDFCFQFTEYLKNVTICNLSRNQETLKKLSWRPSKFTFSIKLAFKAYGIIMKGIDFVVALGYEIVILYAIVRKR